MRSGSRRSRRSLTRRATPTSTGRCTTTMRRRSESITTWCASGTRSAGAWAARLSNTANGAAGRTLRPRTTGRRPRRLTSGTPSSTARCATTPSSTRRSGWRTPGHTRRCRRSTTPTPRGRRSSGAWPTRRSGSITAGSGSTRTGPSTRTCSPSRRWRTGDISPSRRTMTGASSTSISTT